MTLAAIRSLARRSLYGVMALLPCNAAQAITFELEYGDGISGTLNTTMTLGAAMRMQDRASHLVGKANLNPGACGGPSAANQSCQGVNRDQTHPALALSRAPGQASPNFDDGNLNYDKYDLVQAPFKVTQDLSLTYGEFGFFGKWSYFYDFVNNDFTEIHPNRITRENMNRVGSTGDNNSNAVFARTYGPGEVVRSKRSDGEVLRQVGTDLQLLDYYVYGSLPLFGERSLSFKLGNQTLNWGESTVLLINSVNQVNPVNVNNFTRVGFDLSELYVPTGMAYLSTELAESLSIEAFYGYDWAPLEIPAPGSFYSFLDLGTNDAQDYLSISFGGPAEDPDICGAGDSTPDSPFDYNNPGAGCGVPLNNPLSGLTNTSTTIRRLADVEPEGGQFGVSLKYFAEWLNNGTELSFYFLNYHSQLPYLSFFSTDASCARAEGNALGLNARSGPELLAACPDLPTANPNNPRIATSNAVPIDTVLFRFEYPEDLRLFGFSFNTTIGEISLQGEVAFRPDAPLQVDGEDLVFHALGPMLARCHHRNAGCVGSTTSLSQGPNGQETAFPSSEFRPYPGTGITAYADTFDLSIGHAVGSARSFPSFIGAYRGVAPGETPPNSYVRGWEFFDVYQFNLGGTYIQGSTDPVALAIGADQLIWLFEVGAQWVPDLPGTEVLQIESPGTQWHASAGADGSMTGNYRQDCAHTVDCHFGADGLRFNPHQENPDAYADDISWGYAIVNLTRYESVFPGISFQPLTIYQHDVQGTSTDAAGQFSQGRKDISFIFETRYKESLSFNLGYSWYTGGGTRNLLRDRDQALASVKYLF